VRWIKTPPEIVAAFDKAVPADPRVVRKPMFGYPALYLNGNMFAGTFQDKVVVRLSEPGRARAAKTARAVAFEPMPGRPMKEYVVLPSAVVAKPAALGKWIEEARAHAESLPAKTKAAPKRTATKSSASKTTSPARRR
jgi:TfoX/Sxy family transcriptional regulator of competence genes